MPCSIRLARFAEKERRLLAELTDFARPVVAVLLRKPNCWWSIYVVVWFACAYDQHVIVCCWYLFTRIDQSPFSDPPDLSAHLIPCLKLPLSDASSSKNLSSKPTVH